MLISKNCNLVLGDLYFYDFRSCYYTVLENIGWDLSKIETRDKLKRNIQIGYLQKNNPLLGKFLNETARNLISHYIKVNNLKEDDIIITQKDGMIISKKLNIFDDTQPLDLRGIISKLIITTDRKRFLSIFDDGVVEVKGLPNKPIDISFYDKFRSLDFSRKKTLIKGIEYIRQTILNSDRVQWFARKTDDGIYLIPIMGEGDLKINPSGINGIDPSEIDREKIWEELVWPFSRSILIHCQN